MFLYMYNTNFKLTNKLIVKKNYEFVDPFHIVFFLQKGYVS